MIINPYDNLNSNNLAEITEEDSYSMDNIRTADHANMIDDMICAEKQYNVG